jgi:hypothetical protein
MYAVLNPIGPGAARANVSGVRAWPGGDAGFAGPSPTSPCARSSRWALAPRAPWPP